MVAQKISIYPSMVLFAILLSNFSLACNLVTKEVNPERPFIDKEVANSNVSVDDSVVREIVNIYVENHDFDGVISIYAGGKSVYEYTSGKNSGAFTHDTPFPIGSISKVFTAEIIQWVLEKYELDNSYELSSIVPDFKHKKSISIKDLLTHSSGIPDYYNLSEFENIRALEMSTADFAKWIQKFPLDFDPGSQDSYSNSGYNLLAYVAETLCQCAHADLLEASVIKPFGLKSIQSLDQILSDQIPKGYSPGPAPEFVRQPNSIHPGWLKGSGSIVSSSRDLIKLSRMIMARVKENPYWKPFGWGVRQYDSKLFLEQNGRIPGYASHIRVFPSDDVSIVVLSQIESEAVNALAVDLTDHIFGQNADLPELRNYPEVEINTLKEYEGVYQFAPNFFVTVFLSSDGLEMATGKNQKRDSSFLDFTGNDKFFFRVGYTSIRFGRNQNGEVNSLFWAGSGPYPKVDE